MLCIDSPCLALCLPVRRYPQIENDLILLLVDTGRNNPPDISVRLIQPPLRVLLKSPSQVSIPRLDHDSGPVF